MMVDSVLVMKNQQEGTNQIQEIISLGGQDKASSVKTKTLFYFI